jgi:hypothetical protein
MVEPTARDMAALSLKDAENSLDFYCERLRALSKGILALLPNDPSEHPLLSLDSLANEPDTARTKRIELRDGLIATRKLVEMIDGAACDMYDGVSLYIEHSREVLGIPQVGASSSKEAGHA